MVHPQRFFDGWSHQSGSRCICISWFMYIYIYVYSFFFIIYIYTHGRRCIYVSLYVHIYMLYYIHTCIHVHVQTYTCIYTIHVGILSKASLPNEEEKRPRLPPNPRYCAWVNIPRLRWFLVRFKLFISHGEHPQATHIVVWKPRQQRFDSFIFIQWVLLTIQKPGGSPKVPKSLNPWGTLW